MTLKLFYNNFQIILKEIRMNRKRKAACLKEKQPFKQTVFLFSLLKIKMHINILIYQFVEDR